MQELLNKIHQGDALEVLTTFPDNCVDCCVTSPPYYALRDYGHAGQIGLEKSPEEFVQRLVDVFSEVRRVLKPEGTLWVNIGDSYASNGKNRTEEQATRKSGLSGSTKSQAQCVQQISKITQGLKPKDLIGIPWMLAFALRADGWYLRQEIIWAKAYSDNDQNYGSVIPESMTDRFVKSHEQFFLMSKSSRYCFDLEAIKVPIKDSSVKRLSQNVEAQVGSSRVPGKTNGSMKAVAGPQMAREGSKVVGHSGDIQAGTTANRRSVWVHNPSGTKEAHFATFPEDLIVVPIKAGSSGGGGNTRSFYGCWHYGAGSIQVRPEFHRHRTQSRIHQDRKQTAPQGIGAVQP